MRSTRMLRRGMLPQTAQVDLVRTYAERLACCQAILVNNNTQQFLVMSMRPDPEKTDSIQFETMNE